MSTRAVTGSSATVNRDLLIPYMAPYVAYVAIASLPADHIPREWTYAASLLVVVPLLVWGWRRYGALTGPGNPLVSMVTGLLAGILGAAAWILLLAPLAGTAGPAWNETAFALRSVSAGLVVPVFEELLMRGYVLRFAYQWDLARKAGADDPFGTVLYERSIDRVEPGAWSVAAVLISSAVFALGHHVIEWPAAVVYGLLMAGLWIIRKDLLTCVIAHGTTNIVLAVYVWKTGHWGLW